MKNEDILKKVTKIAKLGNIRDRKNIENIIDYEFRRRKIETKRKEEDDRLSIRIGIADFFQDTLIGKRTSIEKCMTNAMANAKIMADEQFKIGTKIVAFAYVKKKLAIECDGYKWHKQDKEQMEKDMERDMYLGKRGWRVLHFSGSHIRRDIEGCINEIKKALFIN